MSFSDLSADQQEAFRARLALAGIDPRSVPALIGPDTHAGQLVASMNPRESTFKAHPLVVDDVERLKGLVGVPDADYEAGLMVDHHPVPDPWPETRDITREELTREERHQVHQAHLNYLFGNSARVSSYRQMINSVEYPRTIPVYAAQDVVITKENSPFRIADPESGHVYGVVTIYAGGSIQFEGHADFNCQQLVKSDEPGPGAG